MGIISIISNCPNNPKLFHILSHEKERVEEKGLKIMTSVMWLYRCISRLEYVNLFKWLCFCVNIWVNRRKPLVQLQITMSKYEKWSFFIRYRHFVPEVVSGLGDRSLKPDPVFGEYETEIKILIILITDMTCLTARAVGGDGSDLMQQDVFANDWPFKKLRDTKY